jgi:hypothetical protein
MGNVIDIGSAGKKKKKLAVRPQRQPGSIYTVGREFSTWTEPERLAVEQEMRELFPDFEQWGGAVTFGHAPSGGEGMRKWLYITFVRKLTPKEHARMWDWVDYADLAVTHEEWSDAPNRWLEPDKYEAWCC